VTFTLSPELIDRLLQEARAAAEAAYVPYSEFPVGACVLTDSGELVRGANIENASYGLTICAERVAVHTAAARGVRTVVAVAVTAPRAAKASPCGACRQVLNEFKPVDRDLVVILDGMDGPSLTTIESLLPDAFGPRDLEFSDT
jgi:cytidine deaminase